MLYWKEMGLMIGGFRVWRFWNKNNYSIKIYEYGQFGKA